LSTSEKRWEKLVSEFRRICLLRRQKRWDEAEMLLKQNLPRSIASWSESFEADLDVKRERLDNMFQTEQRRIEDAFLVQELVATRLNEQFIPLICTQVAQEVRSLMAEEPALQDRRHNRPARTVSNARAPKPRVAFDDIPGVIDLVLAEDRIRESARDFESSLVQTNHNR
jgi:hypothetical protein